ncbi:MAG: class I SAM-dependent methyltransferase [Burkholderiales bacterium]|nr:class I SAM-dependent methyltransferase [Burkholderiales bacterium]
MMTKTLSIAYGVLLGVLTALGGTARAQDDLPRTAGPYVPTPQTIVDRMLQLAAVSKDDVVVDLGSGDGRIVRTAAKVYGASGFGVDIDRELVERSNAAAKSEGLGARAVFVQQDVFKADIRKATVVTLYVLPEMMVGLRPKMLSELRPGTRIVSHDYHFREWLPDNRLSFDVPEKRDAVGFSSTSLYLWIVPAAVGGRWRLEVADNKLPAPVTLNFRQLFQNVNGEAQVGNRTTDIAGTKVRGDTIEFALDAGPRAGGDRFTYRGTVKGDVIEGQVAWGMEPGARRYAWKATRIEPPADKLAH